MTPLLPDSRARFDAAVRRIRRDTRLAACALIAVALPAALIIGWTFAGQAGWAAPSPWPLLLDLAAIVAASGCALWAVRRWTRDAAEERIAAATEEATGLPAGRVRGMLELERGLPVGTSAALARSAQARLWSGLASARAADLGGALAGRARRRRRLTLSALASLAGITVVLGFAAPERTRAGWAPMLEPLDNLRPLPLPALVVSPGDARVRHGDDLKVEVQAPGRRRIQVEWQAAGDVRRAARLPVRGDVATTTLERIDAPTRYWARAPDGAVSDTFVVLPREALLISRLHYELSFPSYLGRLEESYEGEAPPLEIPAGTTLRIRGSATHALEAAELLQDEASLRVRLSVDGAAFSGRWRPRQSGTYTWSLVGADGSTPDFPPPPLELTVIADAAPQVEITYPAGDTLLGPDLRQPVAAAALDDHGVRQAELVSWRVGADGHAEEQLVETLRIDGAPARVLLQGMVDAGERRVLPGDEIRYFVRVRDNSPAAQVGVSPTYALRLPSMAEVRRQVWESTESALAEAARAAESAKQLQQSTRDLERRGAAAGATTGRGAQGQPGTRNRSGSDLDFGGAEEARQILERHEALAQQAEQLRERSEALRRAVQEAGLADPELQRRLDELSRLYEEVLTPELREKLESLRQALDELDAEQVQEALRRLAEEQAEMRERLEQSLELLRRAATEQQMNALAQQARELARREQALAESLREQPEQSAERADQQRELADEAASLERALEELERRLEEQREQEAAEQTAGAERQIGEARAGMQRAADEAAARNGEQAGRTAQQAAEELESAARTLDAAREQLAAEWREEVQRTVEEATNDALALAERQNALIDQMREGSEPESGSAQPNAARLPQPPQPPQVGVERSAGEQEQQEAGASLPQPPGQGQQQSSGSEGQQSGQQQGGSQGAQSQQGAGEQAQAGQTQGEQSGGGQPGARQQGAQGQAGGEGMRAEQAAVNEGLESLGRNLAEAGRRSAMINREVGAALARALLNMQQTLEAMESREGEQRMPIPEAMQGLDALNQLALALLGNQEEIAGSQSGTGLQQALEQLANMARQQGSLNAQTSSLMPMELAPRALAENLRQLGQTQRQISQELDAASRNLGGREDVLGDVDELAREAERLASDMDGGRLTPEMLARQERLFHRLLDAGRSLEREEYSDEREAQRPGTAAPLHAAPLDPRVADALRYPLPTPEQMRALPPAYRRLIQEYFERLNRSEMQRQDERR
ncbi:MAG: hypothetical protein ACRELD_04600 [Longimicrobiales bacterium]